MFRFCCCFLDFGCRGKMRWFCYFGFQPHLVGRRRATGIQMALFESLYNIIGCLRCLLLVLLSRVPIVQIPISIDAVGSR